MISLLQLSKLSLYDRWSSVPSTVTSDPEMSANLKRKLGSIEESVGATATLLVEDTGAKTKAPSLRELALQMVQDGRRWLTMTLMTCNALACHHDALKFLPTKLGSQMLPQPAMVPAQATVHSVLEGDFFTTEKLDELEDFYGEDFMHGSTNLAARRVRFLRFLGCSGAALAKPTEFTEE